MSVVRDEAANQIPSSDNEDSLLFLLDEIVPWIDREHTSNEFYPAISSVVICQA